MIVAVRRVKLAPGIDTPAACTDRSIHSLYLKSTMTKPSRHTWASDGRNEHIEHPGVRKPTIVVPGVELYPLVSATNRAARDLFTALLTLHPTASYPVYTRPFTEVLILIEGDAAIEVEDRRYHVKPIDAMTISPRVARRVINLSSSQPAVFHVALAAGTPEQTWVNGRFTAVNRACQCDGPPGQRANLPEQRRCAV